MPWIDMDYNIKNSPLLMNFYEKIINYIQIISIHLINSIFGDRRECKTKYIIRSKTFPLQQSMATNRFVISSLHSINGICCLHRLLNFYHALN